MWTIQFTFYCYSASENRTIRYEHIQFVPTSTCDYQCCWYHVEQLPCTEQWRSSRSISGKAHSEVWVDVQNHTCTPFPPRSISVKAGGKVWALVPRRRGTSFVWQVYDRRRRRRRKKRRTDGKSTAAAGPPLRGRAKCSSGTRLQLHKSAVKTVVALRERRRRSTSFAPP